MSRASPLAWARCPQVAQVVPPNAPVWDGNIKAGGNGNAWFVKGRMGLAILPGSTQVLDRATNTLVPCNATLCPFGADGRPEPLQVRPRAPASAPPPGL